MVDETHLTRHSNSNRSKSSNAGNSLIQLGGQKPSAHSPVASSSATQIILFIQECGFVLEARDLTVATACVLFHKYKRQSEEKLPDSSGGTIGGQPGNVHDEGADDHVQLVAMSALLLAGKIEENHLNVRKLINVAYKVFFKDKELTDINEYYSIRNSILTIELWLLRLMGFHPASDHPHQYLVCFLKACEDWLSRDLFNHHPVAGVAWSLLHDTYISPIVIREKEEHIAVAIVASTLQLLSLNVAADNAARRSWVKACCHDLSSSHLERLICEITSLYR